VAIERVVRTKRKHVAMRGAVVLALIGAVALATKPGGRPHAPGSRYGCDAVWIGPRLGGEWEVARNWSRGRVPGADERACIPRSTTVVVSRGALRVGSLEDGGRLTVRGGSLQLVARREISAIAELVISHGVLAVSGRLELAEFFWWGPGAHVAGPGDVYLNSSSYTQLVGGEGATLPGGARTVQALASGTLPDRNPTAPAAAPACGPYSPIASRACGSRDRRSAKRVREVWAKFIDIVSSRAAPDVAAPLLAPGLCSPKDCPLPAAPSEHIANSRALVVALRAYLATHERWGRELEDLIVVGDRAYAGAPHNGHVEFGRASGDWVITEL
jgi:hypothetical protein